MLLSPGHSPRRLSTPTPSSVDRALTLAAAPGSAVAAAPTSSRTPRKRGPRVLDEDSYVEAIEKIIERDFFPDIPKLRDRLDWLEAVRSRDPVVIRDVQLKIMERRAKAAGRTPSTARPDATTTAGREQTLTPGSTFFTFPSATPFGSDKTPSFRPPDGSGADKDPTLGEVNVDASLSLDEFFRMYTSEDNESFSKIMEKVNKRRKEKYAHLLERDGEDPVKALEVEKRERITDGYGTSDQPVSTLEGWNYTARNLLMYNPSDREELPLTVEEKAERLKGMTKEINRASTRFHGKSEADTAPATEEGNAAVLYTTVPATTPAGASWPFADREAEKSKKYDLEELRKTPNPYYLESDKKAENGYRYVRTPSPAPGVDASPFMTWGEIEGTPLRLDLEETPIGIGGSSQGPHFSIPCPPTRDAKAHSLSREAARKLRERSKMFQKPPLPLPSPARGGSASPSGRTLSPAAQKFVRNAIAKSSNTVDETLRASYRGKSPLASTPKPHTSSTRFGREASLKSRSPSATQGSASPW